MVESPAWLLKRRRFDAYHKVVSKLWGRKPPVELGKFLKVAGILTFSFIHPIFSEESLLEEAEQSDDNHIPNVDVPQLFAFRELRRPLIIVSLAMLSQQVSGKRLAIPPLLKNNLNGATGINAGSELSSCCIR